MKNEKIIPRVTRSDLLCPFCGVHMQECVDSNAPTIYSCVNGPCPSEVGWAPYEEHLDAYERYKHCDIGVASRCDALPFDCDGRCLNCENYTTSKCLDNK